MAEFVPVEPFDIVIFGVTGDLSRQKLLPALFHRYCDGQIDDSSRIIGVARGAMEAAAFLDLVRQSCSAATDSFVEEKWQKFATLLSYCEIDATDEKADWDGVKAACHKMRARAFFTSPLRRAFMCQFAKRWVRPV